MPSHGVDSTHVEKPRRPRAARRTRPPTWQPGTVSDLRDDVRALFTQVTGNAPDGLWSAPGRGVLLGGEPGAPGPALSFAIDRRTLVAAGGRDDAVIRVATTLTDEAVEIPLADLDAARLRAGWAGVPLGVAWALGRGGADLDAVPGLDLVIDSNVPVGAGLASSTALAVAVAVALDDLWRLGRAPREIAAAVQLAESDYVGASIATGDAEAVLHGRDDAAVLSDDSRVEHVDLGLEHAGLALLVIDTGASDPPGVTAPSPARDGDRVRAVARLLRAARATALGPVLDASHGALREAGRTGPEVDLAVETSRESGALGARGGPGGAVVALAPVDALSRIQVAIDGAFAEHGLGSPEVIPVRPSAGAAREP